MMHAIHKYRLTFDGPGTYPTSLPDWSEIVHVGVQDTAICFWYRRTVKDTPTRNRDIVVVESGAPFPADYEYLGTAIIGPFVYHVLLAS